MNPGIHEEILMKKETPIMRYAHPAVIPVKMSNTSH